MRVIFSADRETFTRLQDLKVTWTRSPEELEVLFCLAEDAIDQKGAFGAMLAHLYCEPVGHA